jgi:hypothetical protein
MDYITISHVSIQINYEILADGGSDWMQITSESDNVSN